MLLRGIKSENDNGHRLTNFLSATCVDEILYNKYVLLYVSVVWGNQLRQQRGSKSIGRGAAAAAAATRIGDKLKAFNVVFACTGWMCVCLRGAVASGTESQPPTNSSPFLQWHSVH